MLWRSNIKTRRKYYGDRSSFRSTNKYKISIPFTLDLQYRLRRSLSRPSLYMKRIFSIIVNKISDVTIIPSIEVF